MPLDPQRSFPVMCLTQDGLGVSHAKQAARLCGAGARWIQLRMKEASPADWLSEARAAARICHDAGATLIVNDSVEVALESGADGVHLGSLDAEWTAARRRAGPGAILGGTVNNLDDARRAMESGCLDYVGVGPLRFTRTKQNLSPVLGFSGVRRLVRKLRGFPAWVVGGVVPSDLPELRRIGAAGVAVSSFLNRAGRAEDNLQELIQAWAQPGRPVPEAVLQP